MTCLCDPIEAIIEVLKDDGRLHDSKLTGFNFFKKEVSKKVQANISKKPSGCVIKNQTETEVIDSVATPSTRGDSECNKECGQKRKFPEDL